MEKQKQIQDALAEGMQQTLQSLKETNVIVDGKVEIKREGVMEVYIQPHVPVKFVDINFSVGPAKQKCWKYGDKECDCPGLCRESC